LEGASVTVVGGKANSAVTDSEGNFVLMFLSDVKAGEIVHVHVEKPGYKPYTKISAISPVIPLIIYLEPIKGATKSKPTPAAEEAPYVITPEMLIGGDHISAASGFWSRQDNVAGSDDVLFPANLAAYVTITSRKSIPVLIKSYSIEAKAEDGSFVRLNELPVLPGRKLYTGDNQRSMSLIVDEDQFLSRAVDGHRIEAFGNVRGWILYQFPVGECRKFVRGFRMTISGYGDKPYVSEFLTPVDGQTSAQRSGFNVHSLIDLSKLPIQFVGPTDQIVDWKPCAKKPDGIE
jgi:hypothetical protein